MSDAEGASAEEPRKVVVGEDELEAKRAQLMKKTRVSMAIKSASQVNNVEKPGTFAAPSQLLAADPGALADVVGVAEQKKMIDEVSSLLMSEGLL